MRVIFNTKTLLVKKTGIGYYIYNLYRELLRSKEVEVYPTVNIDKPIGSVLRFMVSAVSVSRKVLGDSALKFVTSVGDFLISKISGRKNKALDAEIYHEAAYDIIPDGKWKSVANIYDLSFLKHPECLPERILHKCRLNLNNILRADRLIVNTEAIKNEVMVLLKIPGERIDVIPLAPSGAYHPVNRGSMEGKNIVNRYTDREYILYVGTIEPRKNIPVLFKAFSLIRKKRPVKLILAGGKGWLYKDILKMPHELGIEDDVVFTGYVDEQTILYLYNYASVSVYPSIYEGFGLPVIEAMSCGTPVIISDIPSLREVAGDAAMLFNPEDHKELADTIEKVLSSEPLRLQLGQKGLYRAAEFSWKKVAASTIQTYKKALEG